MKNKEAIKRYCDLEKAISPPSTIMHSLESSVMDSINKPKWTFPITVTLASVTAIVMGALLFQKPTDPIPFQVESVMIMEKHTAIWLEPISTIKKG